jgi:hypothetical protein
MRASMRGNPLLDCGRVLLHIFMACLLYGTVDSVTDLGVGHGAQGELNH